MRIALALLVLTVAGSVHGDTLPEDARNLLGFRNLQTAALGAGLAAGIHRWDDDIRGSLEGNRALETTTDLTNVYGASSFNLPLSLGLWFAGGQLDNEAMHAAGARVTRALLLTQVVVGPIKWTIRRRRPDGSNRLSFPSGHTANAFAIARLGHRAHGRRAGLPLYAVALLTGAGRLEDDRHYASDVIMGAFLGIVVGQSVALDPPHDSDLDLRLQSLGERGARLTLHFW